MAIGRITFGINEPSDLLDKLIFDGEKLVENIHPYDFFNFFITASVLYEWTRKHYSTSELVGQLSKAIKEKRPELLPELVQSWIIDESCLPNFGCDSRRHIYNAISLCYETANSSKHYHWHKTSPVTAIENNPEVKDWYQYFFTSTEPSLYIEFSGEYYNLNQIKGILVQFYTGLFKNL